MTPPPLGTLAWLRRSPDGPPLHRFAGYYLPPGWLFDPVDGVLRAPPAASSAGPVALRPTGDEDKATVLLAWELWEQVAPNGDNWSPPSSAADPLAGDRTTQVVRQVLDLMPAGWDEAEVTPSPGGPRYTIHGPHGQQEWAYSLPQVLEWVWQAHRRRRFHRCVNVVCGVAIAVVLAVALVLLGVACNPSPTGESWYMPSMFHDTKLALLFPFALVAGMALSACQDGGGDVCNLEPHSQQDFEACWVSEDCLWKNCEQGLCLPDCDYGDTWCPMVKTEVNNTTIMVATSCVEVGGGYSCAIRCEERFEGGCPTVNGNQLTCSADGVTCEIKNMCDP